MVDLCSLNLTMKFRNSSFCSLFHHHGPLILHHFGKAMKTECSSVKLARCLYMLIEQLFMFKPEFV